MSGNIQDVVYGTVRAPFQNTHSVWIRFLLVRGCSGGVTDDAEGWVEDGGSVSLQPTVWLVVGLWGKRVCIHGGWVYGWCWLCCWWFGVWACVRVGWVCSWCWLRCWRVGCGCMWGVRRTDGDTLCTCTGRRTMVKELVRAWSRCDQRSLS